MLITINSWLVGYSNKIIGAHKDSNSYPFKSSLIFAALEFLSKPFKCWTTGFYIRIALVLVVLLSGGNAPAQILDSNFNPNSGNGYKGFGTVNALAVQPDGKILVGGSFLNWAVQTQPPRTNIARLETNGSIDTNFNPEALGGYVSCLALQTDGKILASGYVTNLGGLVVTNGLSRIFPDGIGDNFFNLRFQYSINNLAAQLDGRIIATSSYINTPLVLILPSGQLDPLQNTLSKVYVYGSPVNCFAVQPDGKIVIGGSFTSIYSSDRNIRPRIARLNKDFTIDTNFHPVTNIDVYCLALQPDGKILVGGMNKTYTNRLYQTNIIRLNTDGSQDTNFNAFCNGLIWSMSLQSDGKICVGGQFYYLNGAPMSYLARLNADGTLDSNFFLPANNYVNALALQADGNILVGGIFSQISGQNHAGLARILNDIPANQSLNFDGTTITWLRSGSSPEVWQASFDYTSNGTNWTQLGTPNRIPGGWQLGGLNFAPNSTIRARGIFSGGEYNGSSSYVETQIGMPVNTNNGPSALTNNAGENVTLKVATAGGSPLAIQWFNNGVSVNGATQSTLAITNIQGFNSGNYSVVLSNSWGSTTSLVASLYVNVAGVDSFNPPFLGRNATLYTNSDEVWGVQTDGKIIVQATAVPAGYFYSLNRLKTNGLVDTSFVGSSMQINGFVMQGNGTFIAAGSHIFTILDKNGNRTTNVSPTGSGWINSLAVQRDGKILVGGDTNLFNLSSQPFNSLGRLNADLTFDNGFARFLQRTRTSLVVPQPDGKILLCGNFSNLWGESRTNIGRLNEDGSLDTGFKPSVLPFDFIEGTSIYTITVQPDGKILVGGSFTSIAGASQNSLARLNNDGSLDTNFTPAIQGKVHCIAVQADGKIIAGGAMTNVSGYGRTNIVRLNSDGTVDTNFFPSANGRVSSLVIQPDGKILVGGLFTILAGQSRTNLGRLLSGTAALQTLTYDGSTISWMRGGSSPEVWRTTFESSMDGTNWTFIGNGNRIAGGWQFNGSSSLLNSLIRARGYPVIGNTATYYEDYNSTWFVESILTPPFRVYGTALSTNGQFSFNASGLSGQMVIVEASSDLKVWVPLQTNTLGSLPISFTDTQAPGISNRFYRLRKGP